MTIPQNRSVMWPRLVDLLDSHKRETFRTLNCVKVGTINKFDSAAKTAEIKLAFKRTMPDGSLQTYPLLVDCPVFTLQGGGGALTFPIAAGDECLVLFSDRSLDAWHQNGGTAEVLDNRTHDLSDGIALVGLNSLAGVAVAYLANETALQYAGAEFGLKGGKATVKNATTSLLALLEGLIDVLKALLVQGPSTTYPLTTASIAALEAYKTQMEALLYP